MPTLVAAIALLVGSNVFMTLAWYGHLRWLEGRAWLVAVLIAWSLALFEYLLQVPANRLAFQKLSLPQLKLLQEVITLVVFVPVASRLFKLEFRWDHVWAACCLVGAVYFTFRGGLEV